MDNVDLEVLRNCVKWLQGGRRVTLVTVTRTWGSSPRPAGAMLALRDDGLVTGSVSGGCIEDDLIHRARTHTLTGDKPEVVTYGISGDEARKFGLPCGGTIQVVLEPLRAAAPMQALLKRVERRELVARELDIATGASTLRAASADEGLTFDGKRLVNVFGPRYRLIIIGAGQLSRFIAQIALGLDYQVTICDPRSEYMDLWDVPEVALVRGMPDDVVREMRPDAHTAVIALTHDPKLDDMALMEALKSQAFYVGAIGSRANNEKRRARLREFDVTEEELAKLHGPIGIYIGSRTPPEIAISILAEMTAVKNGVVLPPEVRVDVAKAAQASTAGCVVV
ncbi:MAG TPA: XdhC family protein [Burkholderiales bacterium]